MKIKLKNILKISMIFILTTQLVGCEPKTEQENVLTVEEEKQLLLEEKRANELKEIEEKEELEEKSRKKLQSNIKELEEDVDSLIQYVLVYDISSEISKRITNIDYVTIKENTLAYQKINNSKERIENYDETLKGYANLHIEHIEELQSISINMINEVYGLSKKGSTNTNTTAIAEKYKQQMSDTTSKYQEKLTSYYTENLLDYEKENNVSFKNPLILLINSFYKVTTSLENTNN